MQLLAEHLGSPRCAGCARVGHVVCEACRSEIAPALPPPDAQHLDRVLAAWDYDGVARALVLALKLRRRREAATALGAAIVERVWSSGLAVDSITWIPARKKDIRARGFDHAHLIAAVVARDLGLPLVRALDRTGPRADQSTLGAAGRRVNQIGAFVGRYSGRRVGVVDDLMTTGATLSDAARALREVGTLRVEGLVACFVS